MVLGVDGGGTQTRAAICDLEGRVLGTGLGGPTNIDDVGLPAARTHLRQAVQDARTNAQLDERPFEATFLGMAGIVSAQDRAQVQEMACSLNLAPPERIGVDHDCRIALAGGLAGRPGIVLIVGTGSSCYGRTADGRSWRAGGWGWLISDEGSGYFLGREGLAAAARALDGRGPPTALAAALLEHLGVQRPEELLHRLYVAGLSRSEIAALAPKVLVEAQGGDPVALELLSRGAALLSECVQAVAQHLYGDPTSVELVVQGGLYAGSKLFRAKVNKAVLVQVPGCRMVSPELPPVLGACLLAYQMLGAVPAVALAQMRKGIHDH